MNPIGTRIQTSPEKKGYLRPQPRWLKVFMGISFGILASSGRSRRCRGHRASHKGFPRLRPQQTAGSGKRTAGYSSRFTKFHTALINAQPGYLRPDCRRCAALFESSAASDPTRPRRRSRRLDSAPKMVSGQLENRRAHCESLHRRKWELQHSEVEKQRQQKQHQHL